MIIRVPVDAGDVLDQHDTACARLVRPGKFGELVFVTSGYTQPGDSAFGDG